MTRDLQAPSDEELARQAQAGSLAPFEELVYRYEGRIYRFVANSCRVEADAREITQETFVRAFQALDQFDARRFFAPWLFAIARRKCLDHHRASARIVGEPLPETQDEETPADLLSREEERANIWLLARRCLPELQFQALWLRYAEEMETAQIGRVLRKTRSHVKVLLFRARQSLGKSLARKEDLAGVPARRSAFPSSLVSAPKAQ